LIKAVEDSNVFVSHFSKIVARIKCVNECRGFYRVIEAADWLSVMWRTSTKWKENDRMAEELCWWK